MRGYDNARQAVLSEARAALDGGATSVALLEASNNTEAAYAYALIVDGRLVRGLVAGHPRRERKAFPVLEGVLKNEDWDRIIGGDARQSHGRCFFLTLVAGSRSKQVAIFGEPEGAELKSLLEELVPALEGPERAGPVSIDSDD